MASIYDHKDFRSYLKEALPVKGPGRGSRARLADALGCKGGFISLVLSGDATFNEEHAIAASSFLNHDDEERDYFMLLVGHARAGSKNLENYYLEKIEGILQRRRAIKERIRVKAELAPAEQTVYYSTWHYIAVHMGLFTPDLQTKSALAKHFRLSIDRVSEILRFLVEAGMAEQREDRYIAHPSRTHLAPDSPLILQHHTNWRLKALQSLGEPEIDDLHYSLVMSASTDAAEKIREILLTSIQTIEPVLKKAEDERGYVLAIDLFGLQ